MDALTKQACVRLLGVIADDALVRRPMPSDQFGRAKRVQLPALVDVLAELDASAFQTQAFESSLAVLQRLLVAMREVGKSATILDCYRATESDTSAGPSDPVQAQYRVVIQLNGLLSKQPSLLKPCVHLYCGRADDA